MGKRSYGEGGMTQVRKGVWRLRVYVGDPMTGKRRQVGKTVRADGVKEAREELRRFMERAQDAPGGSRKVTFGTLLADWLANLEREGGKAPATIDTYRRHVANHIEPRLGALPVREISGRALDAFYSDLAAVPLEASTIRTIHAVTMTALRQALDWDLIERVPRARPPKPASAERDPLTPEQINQLIAGAKERNLDALALLIRLAATTGARRGELLGLQVADYDRDARTLDFRRQVTATHGIQPPKRNKQRRTAISEATARAIDAWLAMNRERFHAEHGPWLLSNDGGVTSLRPNRVSEAVSRLGSDLGISVHTHAFRHAHDALGVAAGVPLSTMAQRAGHTAEIAARVYLHPVEEADRRAADVMADLLGS